jgi:hypothetical protein
MSAYGPWRLRLRAQGFPVFQCFRILFAARSRSRYASADDQLQAAAERTGLVAEIEQNEAQF